MRSSTNSFLKVKTGKVNKGTGQVLSAGSELLQDKYLHSHRKSNVDLRMEYVSEPKNFMEADPKAAFGNSG